uniref:Uncharacterized protein n=1 Tax=viral metagenome TaxID=1070528 RepID=A0A6M3J582_9ZZZZ
MDKVAWEYLEKIKQAQLKSIPYIRILLKGEVGNSTASPKEGKK